MFLGPGMGFVAYPEGIAQMPAASVWAVMFFFMLFTIGLGSQVRNMTIDNYSIYTNNWPGWCIGENDYFEFFLKKGRVVQ